MSVNRNVKIGDLQYEVKFPSRLMARATIERAAGRKALWEVISNNTFDDHCAVIWAGLKHANKRLTVEDVAKLLQEHEDVTGQDYTEIWKVVIEVAFEDKLLGLDTNYEHLRRMFGLLPDKPAEGGDGAEGKASA